MILFTGALTLPASAGGEGDTKHQIETRRKTADAGVERALRPLREKHIQSLEKLVAAKTKAGKLEEALLVKKELAIAHLAGRWLVRDGPIVVTINRHGQIFDEAGNVRGHWEFEAKQFSLCWDNGSKWTILIPEKFGATTGLDAGGKSFTYTRVPGS